MPSVAQGLDRRGVGRAPVPTPYQLPTEVGVEETKVHFADQVSTVLSSNIKMKTEEHETSEIWPSN